MIVAPAFFPWLAFAGFLVTWLVQSPRRPTVGLPWWKQLALPAALILGGSAGSKLPVVLASADWVADGRTLTTALALAYVLVEVTRCACLMPPSTRDSVALPLSLALVVARLGCFVNGCCRGVASSLCWAVDFGDGVRRHPTQLYESCFHLLCGAAIAWLRRREVFRGEVLRLYLLAYCIFRFATEWIRLEPASWLGLTYSQGIVALLGIVLVILWGLDVLGSRATGPRDLPVRRAVIMPRSPDSSGHGPGLGKQSHGLGSKGGNSL